jgi:hypothetical protein
MRRTPTTAPAPDAGAPTGPRVRITHPYRDGISYAGRAWPSDATYEPGELTDAEIAAARADAGFTVETLGPGTPTSAPPADSTATGADTTAPAGTGSADGAATTTAGPTA